MAKTFSYFVAILMLSLFYGFGSTLLTYTMNPYLTAPQQQLTVGFGIDDTSITDITGKIQGATSSQLRIPVLDVGALVFYSGNILVDLMFNSFFALPSLVSVLTNAFVKFFAVDAIMIANLEVFLFALISVAYFINMIGFLLSIRSGLAGGQIA